MLTEEQAEILFRRCEALVNESKLEEAWEIMRTTKWEVIPSEYHGAFKALAGVAYGLGGNHVASLNLLLEAEQLGVRTAGHYENIGRSLQMLGRVSEAIKYIKKSHKMSPSIKSSYTLGYYLRMVGNTNYRSYFEHAVNRKSESTRDHYYSGLANMELKRFDKAIEHLLISVNASEIGLRLNSHYALGECYDGAGDVDNAWKYWTLANQKNIELIGEFDKDTYAAAMETHKIFPGTIEPFIDSPFIHIVGMPRSGSTLLEHMLCAKDDIETVQEWSGIHDLIGQVDPFPEAWFELTDIDRMVVLGGLVNSAWQVIGNRAPVIIDKCLPNYGRVGFLSALFKKPRILWMKRNRNDVRLSCFSNQFVNHKYTNTLEEIDWVMDQHDQLFDYWNEHADIKEVQYEELVDNPAAVLRDICDYCDIEYEDRMAQKKTKRDVHTIKGHLVYEPVTKTRIDRWKKYETYLKLKNESSE